MIARYLIIGLMSMVMALGGYSWWQGKRVAGLQADLVPLRMAMAQAAEAAAVHRAHIDRMTVKLAETEAEILGLKNMEGQDAPLSPLLSAAGTAAARILRK